MLLGTLLRLGSCHLHPVLRVWLTLILLTLILRSIPRMGHPKLTPQVILMLGTTGLLWGEVMDVVVRGKVRSLVENEAGMRVSVFDQVEPFKHTWMYT